MFPLFLLSDLKLKWLNIRIRPSFGTSELALDLFGGITIFTRKGITFAVDSSDRERVENAKEELQLLLHEDGRKDAALLVFANKQDLSGAMSSTEVAEKLDLVTVNDREWGIQGACAITGDGLYDGLDWICSTTFKKK